jgi:hypothetical protein
MAERMTGHTASLWESAWHGLIIKVNEEDDSEVIVQRFYDGIYEEPVTRPINHYETGGEDSEMGFTVSDEEPHVYTFNEFLRDDYMTGNIK